MPSSSAGNQRCHVPLWGCSFAGFCSHGDQSLVTDKYLLLQHFTDNPRRPIIEFTHRGCGSRAQDSYDLARDGEVYRAVADRQTGSVREESEDAL